MLSSLAFNLETSQFTSIIGTKRLDLRRSSHTISIHIQRFLVIDKLLVIGVVSRSDRQRSDWTNIFLLLGILDMSVGCALFHFASLEDASNSSTALKNTTKWVEKDRFIGPF
jgi:hypothetical protein